MTKSSEVKVTDKHDLDARVAEGLRATINRHGHAFQHAVLRRGEKLAGLRASKWLFDFAELPVEVRGQSTRIDFVLHQMDFSRGGPVRFLVAECKRANPALSNWCFVKAPYVKRDHREAVLVDSVQRLQDQVAASVMELLGAPAVYGIGYEIRGDEKGEGGPGRSAIEDAAGQVMRGVNGLIELFALQPDLLALNQATPIIPVIFTTANLWVSDVDVGSAELSSGALPSGSVVVERKPWLWWQYQPGPGIVHSLPRAGGEGELSRLGERWYTRTIAVVAPDGIDAFLQREY